MGSNGLGLLLWGCWAGVLLIGCGLEGGQACTLKGCLNAIAIQGLAPNGEVIQDLRGTVQFDGQSKTFSCGLGDACVDGSYSLVNAAESQPELTLDLTDGQGRRYTGPVTPNYVVDSAFNGRGCGTCTSGEVTVTLR